MAGTTLTTHGYRVNSKFDAELEERMWEYVRTGFIEEGHGIPSIAGLAVYLKIPSSTIKKWIGKGAGNLLQLRDALEDMQQQVLLHGGLVGKFNPTITKLVLSRHGYSERLETTVDHTSGGKPLQPASFKGVNKEERVVNPDETPEQALKPIPSNERHKPPAAQNGLMLDGSFVVKPSKIKVVPEPVEYKFERTRSLKERLNAKRANNKTDTLDLDEDQPY